MPFMYSVLSFILSSIGDRFHERSECQYEGAKKFYFVVLMNSEFRFVNQPLNISCIPWLRSLPCCLLCFVSINDNANTSRNVSWLISFKSCATACAMQIFLTLLPTDFYFQVSRIFWYHFMRKSSVQLRCCMTFYISSKDQKLLRKHDFVYYMYVYANGFFFNLLKRYDYFHFHWLKSINLSMILLGNCSVINFVKKKQTNKQKW